MRGSGTSAVCLAAFLGGCAAVGPDYQRPVLEAPAQWAETKQTIQAHRALQEVAWWKAFGDPVLDSLIERAARANLDVQQARARIVQARAALAVAGAVAMPSVNAAGSVTRGDNSENAAARSAGPSVPLDTSPTTLYQAGFDASWEIDLFGGNRRAREAAQAKFDASVEDLRVTLLTVLGEIARNYVLLCARQEQLAITRRNIEVQRQTIDVTRERYRLGLTSYLDVTQAVAQRAATESEIPAIEASIKQSIHRLGILLGRGPNALKAELSTAHPLPRPDGVIAAGLPSELLTRRPDLRRVERQLAAASAEIGVAVADLYPKFDLTLGVGLQSSSASNFANAASRYWSFGSGISAPLFTGGRVRANIEERRAVYQEMLDHYRSAFNSALEDVENALATFYAEQARHRFLVESMRSSEEAVALASERYRKGLTSFLDVLVAERSMYEAQRNVSESAANLLTSLVSLYKTLGGGWGAHEVSSPVPGKTTPGLTG